MTPGQARMAKGRENTAKLEALAREILEKRLAVEKASEEERPAAEEALKEVLERDYELRRTMRGRKIELNPVAKYEANRARRELEARSGLSANKIKQRDALRKARETLQLKREMKSIVEQKVLANIPITAAEEELLAWTPGVSKRLTKKEKEEIIVGQASKLLIRPQNVSELRVLVEDIARKHRYNPLEALIKQVKEADEEDGTPLTAEQKIAIHKVLLPFLVPQIQLPKQKNTDDDNNNIRVTISQFVFPAKPPSHDPIHKQVPTTVIMEAVTPPPAVPDAPTRTPYEPS